MEGGRNLYVLSAVIHKCDENVIKLFSDNDIAAVVLTFCVIRLCFPASLPGSVCLSGHSGAGQIVVIMLLLDFQQLL